MYCKIEVQDETEIYPANGGGVCIYQTDARGNEAIVVIRLGAVAEFLQAVQEAITPEAQADAKEQDVEDAE